MGDQNRSFIAIYIDLENVPGSLNIQKLMQDIIIKHEAGIESLFAVKMACGNSSSISRLRGQLKEQNFEIRETPHLSRKKNRADLAISIAAFESLYLNNPSIDKYVFVTNDSDFTVVMDVLRKYGKEVWLVAQEQESRKPLFNSCSDNILIVEDYLETARSGGRGKAPPVKSAPVKTAPREAEPDRSAIVLFRRVLQKLDSGKIYFNSQLGMKFHQVEKSFNLKKTRFKNFNSLVEYFVTKGILEKVSTVENNVQVRIADEKKLEEI
jgi:uncharacterized LabA/DUF88 family protein